MSEQPREEKDPWVQEKQDYIEWAQRRLERNLGIEKLSTIEGVALRNIVEELIPKYIEERKLIREGRMSMMNLAEIEEEAGALWLHREYGINPKDVPSVFIIEDGTTGESFSFEKVEEDLAERKLNELSELGHQCDVFMRVPDDFKEYIRRLREKEHHDF